MAAYVARRLLMAIPVMFGVTLVVFLMMRLAPGDVAILMVGPRYTPEALAEARERLGLDKPLPAQYFIWLWHAMQGDLGRSIRQGEEVRTLVFDRFQNSVILGVTAFMLTACIGISVGVLTAVKRGSLLDRVVVFLSMLGVSTPAFFLGMVLIVVFAVKIPILPSGGMHDIEGSKGPLDVAYHLVLPAITLALPASTVVARVVRSSMLEVIGQDYVRTAYAKGLRSSVVITRHVLKNALIPVISLLGLQAGFLLAGSAIVEVVFSYPGIGNLTIKSISDRDLPVTQGCVLVIAVVYVLINIAADLIQGLLDPRISVH
jgi:peptide/nickel transport system permease protein